MKHNSVSACRVLSDFRGVLIASIVGILLATTAAKGQEENTAPIAGDLLEEIADPNSDELKERAEAAKKLAKDRVEAEKPPFEIGPLLPALGQEYNQEAVEGPAIVVKPGHWTPTVQSMKANYEDFIGEATAEVVDKNDQPIALPHQRYGLELARPVVLAKGKGKSVDGNLYVPPGVGDAYLRSLLVDHDTGTIVREARPQIVLSPSYQYVLVVLAKEPDQYSYLKATNTVRSPYEEEFEENSQPHYRVALLNASRKVRLSDNPLEWTEIAYLLWDEVDHTWFSQQQQEALIDWLHWGGRVIVNGPDSLASLRGSFLDKYLPADDEGILSLSTEDFRAWCKYWGQREQAEPIPPLELSRNLSAIKLKPRKNAQQLPGGGNLFYESLVGRGSIVVSAVRLTDRALINWPGFDGFLNSGLLRRPRRIFSPGPYGGIRSGWADYSEQRLDAHFTTPLRLFARDAFAATNYSHSATVTQDIFGMQSDEVIYRVDRAGGIASWDDDSPVSATVRELLRVASGVRVPGSGFVLTCLLLYLVVLVPVNWLVFRAVDRIEWAWAAVPLIALMGTWVVVKQAQLDIGFVRSETEIALLELQGDDPRGHLSRYTALYSSLSTTYDTSFEECPTAQALPFPVSQESPGWETSVVYEEKSSPSLLGLTVSSSAARLLHVEQMFALDGPIRMGVSSRDQKQVENRSQLLLQDAFLLHRSYSRQGSVRYEGSWLGELRPGNSALIVMLPMSLSEKTIPFETERNLAHDARQQSTTQVDSLLQLACQFEQPNDPLQTDREEYRLIAVVNERLPGMEVSPSASQKVGATVVVAHLDYGFWNRVPLPDVNTPPEIKQNIEEQIGL